MKILKMLEEGKISADEASRLLQAVSKTTPGGGAVVTGEVGQWLRVRVTDIDSGQSQVNITIPMRLVDVGLRLGGQFIPDLDSVDMDELAIALRSGAKGKLMDIEDEVERQRVEIYVE